jgi:signal transduction histidine kinase
MSRRLLVGLAVAGVAIITTAALLVHFAQDFQPPSEAEDPGQLMADAVFIVTGLIAWQKRPDNPVGPLLTALGFVEALSLCYWDAVLPFMLAALVATLVIPLIVHLFVVFPHGHLSTRFERSLVGFAYAATLVLIPLAVLFWDPQKDAPDAPRNVLQVGHSETVSGALDALAAVFSTAALVTAGLLLVYRAVRSRGPARRAYAPVLLTGSVALVGLGVATILEAAGAAATGIAYEVSGLAFVALPIAFLVGLLRTRLRRSEVADLVVALGSPLTPAQARDAIARTLHDDTLELVFWLPDRACYVSLDGREVEVGDDPGRAVTVLEHHGNRVAALVHDPVLLDDPGLAEAVSAAAALALENARLHVELRAQLNEVRASRARIVAAGDAERSRLERDLHDGAQQRLLGIRLALQLIRGRMADPEPEVDELLTEADAEVAGALDELRALARGIHPALLTEEGLDAAVAALVRRVPLPVELTTCGERFSPNVEATAYFVASEALANVVKHAYASRATVTITRNNGLVAIEVADDGIGGANSEGAGLRGLRDRVETADGQLRIESLPGQGTRIEAGIPCG